MLSSVQLKLLATYSPLLVKQTVENSETEQRRFETISSGGIVYGECVIHCGLTTREFANLVVPGNAR